MSTAHAELHGTLTFTTNNVGRWFTKSNNHPSLLANLDYQYESGWYLGTLASTINFDNKSARGEANTEIIPYLGWSTKLPDEWRLDVQWSRYLFDGKVFGANADYNEFYLFLHYKDWLTGRFSASENYYALGGHALDYELTARYPLTDRFELSASFGYSQTEPVLGSDYPYWNFGISYFYKFLSLDLRYRDAADIKIDSIRSNQSHERYEPPMIEATCVFSISMGF